MNNPWPESTCVECGKPIPAGTIQRCERGGECNWHVPYAMSDVMAGMYKALKASEAYRYSKPSPFATDHECQWCNVCVDQMHKAIKAALAKAEGR